MKSNYSLQEEATQKLGGGVAAEKRAAVALAFCERALAMRISLAKKSTFATASPPETVHHGTKVANNSNDDE